MNNEQFITASEAGSILKLCPRRMRSIAMEGKIGTKIGSQWLFTRREVATYAREERFVGISFGQRYKVGPDGYKVRPPRPKRRRRK